jgi:glycosyltransferase involved in cell wall biosynthesis
MTPLHIGMFTTSLPEPGRKPGGVDVLIDRLATQLALRGHRVTVFTYSPPPEDARYGVARLGPPGWRHRKLMRMFAVPLALNGVDFGDVDVLHIHGDDYFFRRRRVPTVRSYYGSALEELRSATRWRRRLSQAVVYALELIAAPLAIANYGLIPGDGPRFRLRGSLGCGVEIIPNQERTTRPTVLFVGTWRGRKRGQHLAEAFERDVMPRVPNAQLIMVSDEIGDARPWMTHLPRPRDDELRHLYAQAWVFCLPSSYEGFGIPYLEAMAAGTPIVATSNPGADYLTRNGSVGRLVELSDLGCALAELLSDPAERSRLGQLGRARAAAFSWDVICSGHVEAYQHAIRVWSQQQ